MRKIISLIHMSLDGFVAGPKGEMNWIKVPDELFDFVKTLTDKCDAALYGRTTYEMMQNYWPKAGEKQGATKHDKEHSKWYNSVQKIVLSRTMKSNIDKTTVISSSISQNIEKIKQAKGKDILLLGSPGATQSLLNENLVDEFWISINPILLGSGKPFFENIKEQKTLKLSGVKTLPEGLVVLHYTKLKK